MPTLHGPMPGGLRLGGEQGPEPRPGSTCGRPCSAGARAGHRRPGARARPGRPACSAGGNLSLLASLCGTRYQPSFAGRIVLLEDIGEEPYRVDRMLTQLLQAGAFDGVRGIALGSWVDCGDPYPVLRDRLLPLGVPVLAGLPVGPWRTTDECVAWGSWGYRYRIVLAGWSVPRRGAGKVGYAHADETDREGHGA